MKNIVLKAFLVLLACVTVGAASKGNVDKYYSDCDKYNNFNMIQLPNATLPGTVRPDVKPGNQTVDTPRPLAIHIRGTVPGGTPRPLAIPLNGSPTNVKYLRNYSAHSPKIKTASPLKTSKRKQCTAYGDRNDIDENGSAKTPADSKKSSDNKPNTPEISEDINTPVVIPKKFEKLNTPTTALKRLRKISHHIDDSPNFYAEIVNTCAKLPYLCGQIVIEVKSLASVCYCGGVDRSDISQITKRIAELKSIATVVGMNGIKQFIETLLTDINSVTYQVSHDSSKNRGKMITAGKLFSEINNPLQILNESVRQSEIATDASEMSKIAKYASESIAGIAKNYDKIMEYTNLRDMSGDWGGKDLAAASPTYVPAQINQAIGYILKLFDKELEIKYLNDVISALSLSIDSLHSVGPTGNGLPAPLNPLLTDNISSCRCSLLKAITKSAESALKSIKNNKLTNEVAIQTLTDLVTCSARISRLIVSGVGMLQTSSEANILYLGKQNVTIDKISKFIKILIDRAKHVIGKTASIAKQLEITDSKSIQREVEEIAKSATSLHNLMEDMISGVGRKYGLSKREKSLVKICAKCNTKLHEVLNTCNRHVLKTGKKRSLLSRFWIRNNKLTPYIIPKSNSDETNNTSHEFRKAIVKSCQSDTTGGTFDEIPKEKHDLLDLFGVKSNIQTKNPKALSYKRVS